MKNTDCENILKSLIIENASIGSLEEIKSDTDIVSDFGYDSIRIIQLIIDIEHKLNIKIDDDFLRVDVISNYDILLNHIMDKINLKIG